MSDRFLQGSLSSPGSYINAGAPEIYGSLVNDMAKYKCWIEGDGAFIKTTGSGSSYDTFGSGSDHFGNNPVYFYASDYNSIYGASSTIQPLSLTVNFYIKYI